MPNDGGSRPSPQRFGILILRILVTGAAGFTGKHFAQAAESAGHKIITLTSDLTDRRSVEREVKETEAPDAVVHLGAISFVGHADETAFYAVNTVGTTHLLSALAQLPPAQQPKKIIVASSANVYGNCTASPIAETELPKPVNHYAASKLAMEHMARSYCERLPIVIVRPFNYTGPGQHASFLIPKMVDHFSQRAQAIELGNTQVEREFNDVRMVCEAYLALIQNGCVGQTYNVCSGNPFTLMQVISHLRDLTGHDIEIKLNPELVRKNEVTRLCGDPSHLVRCIGELPQYSIRDTLSSMLITASQKHPS